MKKKDKKTLEALKMAKQAVDLANNALMSAIQELNDDELDNVAGGGKFDDVPPLPRIPTTPMTGQDIG